MEKQSQKNSSLEYRDAVSLENQGEKIFGIFHRPLHSPSQKTPAVLMCHGFAGNKAGKHRIYVKLAMKLASFGIAVLRIDFRGSGDSEGDLLDMTLTQEASDAVVGLKYLTSLTNIDPEKIGLFGRSLGGPVALMTAAQFASVKSIALWAPLFSAEAWRSDWEIHQKNHPQGNIPKGTLKIDGQIAGEPFIRELFDLRLENILSQLGHIPLLHIHGLQDVVIKPEHGAQYLACRKPATAKTKSIVLPFSDHDFTMIAEQERAIEETANWFKETL